MLVDQLGPLNQVVGQHGPGGLPDLLHGTETGHEHKGSRREGVGYLCTALIAAAWRAVDKSAVNEAVRSLEGDGLRTSWLDGRAGCGQGGGGSLSLSDAMVNSCLLLEAMDQLEGSNRGGDSRAGQGRQGQGHLPHSSAAHDQHAHLL